MKFTARADGGITIYINLSISEVELGYSQNLSVVIDIDLTDKFDEQYIPANLADYDNYPVDLEEIIASLLGE